MPPAGRLPTTIRGRIDSSRVSAIPSIKIDQNMGSKGRLSFYSQKTHTHVPRTPTGADAFQNEITGFGRFACSGHTIRLNYDYTATPRLLLHLGAGWNDSEFGLQADFERLRCRQGTGPGRANGCPLLPEDSVHRRGMPTPRSAACPPWARPVSDRVL